MTRMKNWTRKRTTTVAVKLWNINPIYFISTTLVWSRIWFVTSPLEAKLFTKNRSSHMFVLLCLFFIHVCLVKYPNQPSILRFYLIKQFHFRSPDTWGHTSANLWQNCIRCCLFCATSLTDLTLGKTQSLEIISVWHERSTKRGFETKRD